MQKLASPCLFLGFGNRVVGTHMRACRDRGHQQHEQNDLDRHWAPLFLVTPSIVMTFCEQNLFQLPRPPHGIVTIAEGIVTID